MSGAIPPLPNTPSWGGAELKKHRDFTFLYFTYTCSMHGKDVKGKVVPVLY
jgi:hypothetical protein